MKAKLFGAGAAIAGLAAMFHGCEVYLTRTVTPMAQSVADGYNRAIWPAPFGVRLLYDLGDGLWPGAGWALFDWVVFFGLVAIAVRFSRMALAKTR